MFPGIYFPIISSFYANSADILLKHSKHSYFPKRIDHYNVSRLAREKRDISFSHLFSIDPSILCFRLFVFFLYPYIFNFRK